MARRAILLMQGNSTDQLAERIINGEWADVVFGPAVEASSAAVVSLLIVGGVFVSLATWTESYTIPVIWLIIGGGALFTLLPGQARVIGAILVALAVASTVAGLWYYGDRGGSSR
jgi:hypothetical protein